MAIYVSSSVIVKQDEYVEFLMRNCRYNLDEAETRRWEIEYQIWQHCSPVLMKAGTSGTIKFRTVLQRQEIERFVGNRLQLSKIIKRRKGTKGDTQWKVGYCVSNSGDVFILTMECYNTFSENLAYNIMKQYINECVNKCIRQYLTNTIW